MAQGYLESQIASRLKRLAALDSERATLLGELSAYEDALKKSTDGSFDLKISREPERARSLPISRAWLTILHRLADFKNFNASEVMLVARALYDEGKLKKPQTKDGVRAQLSLYVKKGILKRRGGGNYLVTDETKAALEFSAGTSLGQSS